MKYLFAILINTFLLSIVFARSLPEQGAQFITSALCDHQGGLWVASEKDGLWQLKQGSDTWQKMEGNGLLSETKNYYALVEDLQGRIWVGTDNKGVFVWNGTSWKQYDVTNTLLGEKIYDIAVSPLNGDVAVSSSGGISIYQPVKDRWIDRSHWEGLPENQIISISYDEQGRLWGAGLTCGVVCSSTSSDYMDWQVTQTQWYWDKEQTIRQPLISSGEGISSNFCNVIASYRGNVWVGSISGLSHLVYGKKWRYLRGADYRAKNEGLWVPPHKKGEPKNRIQARQNTSNKKSELVLPEDYVTALYPTPNGLWLGFREKGICLYQSSRKAITSFTSNLKKEENLFPSISCFVALEDGSLYAGTYGQGLVYVSNVGNHEHKQLEIKNSHPSYASLPSLEIFSKNLSVSQKQKEPREQAKAYFWNEDWATQGDWCQRYGEDFMCLFAVNPPSGSFVGSFSDVHTMWNTKGPHIFNEEGAVAHRLLSINDKNDRNVLYCPDSTTRTRGEITDRGNNVPRNWDGPDLGFLVFVPNGRQLVSLYFYDPTPLIERNLKNNLKDFILEIRKLPKDFDLDHFFKRDPDKDPFDQEFDQVTPYKEPIDDDLELYISSPVLARGRVKNFAACGVYQNFILDGAGWYYVRILKNYSTSTTINGAFMSTLDETAKTVNRVFMPDEIRYWACYGKVPPHPPFIDIHELKKLPNFLYSIWANGQNINRIPADHLADSRRLGIYAYRHLAQLNKFPLMEANWRWRLKIWTNEDKKDFDDQIKKAWRGLQDYFPPHRSSEWSCFAPDTTVPFSVDEVETMEARKIDWKQYLPDAPNAPKLSVEEMKELLKN